MSELTLYPAPETVCLPNLGECYVERRTANRVWLRLANTDVRGYISSNSFEPAESGVVYERREEHPVLTSTPGFDQYLASAKSRTVVRLYYFNMCKADFLALLPPALQHRARHIRAKDVGAHGPITGKPQRSGSISLTFNAPENFGLVPFPVLQRTRGGRLTIENFPFGLRFLEANPNCALSFSEEERQASRKEREERPPMWEAFETDEK